MIIKESAENYLETIYVLSKRIGAVRSIDVANEMNFSKPSVSVKMKQFRENGYINMDKDGIISLTDKGMGIATQVYERHEIIAHVLMILGVGEETAYEDSCKIEHDLSDESFEKIKEFYYKNK